MPGVQELPTEILCAIFELSSDLMSNASPRAPNGSPSTTTSTIQAENSDFCALLSQKDIIFHCIALSHVCLRWRYVAIDLHTLWTRIYLGQSAFVSGDYNDVKATETSSLFLLRSANLPLHLDISFELDPIPLSWMQKARFEKNIRIVLLPHIERLRSLRVVSSEPVLTAVLDVFLERNISSSPNDLFYTPLNHLHLQVGTSPSVTRSTQPFFPPDLNLVAPHLTTLRVDGIQVSAFPKWKIQMVALTDTFLSYHNHFHLFMKTPARKLFLHRVTIPGGLPYVRRLTQQHPSSVVTVVLSELRCAGPENEHRDIYTLFFTLSLHHNLQELELLGLSKQAMHGLVTMLAAPPLMIFGDLRRLVLQGLCVDIMAAEVMVVAFPAVTEMVVNRVEGGPHLVHGFWRVDISVWPQLVEILLDGENIRRR